MHIVNENNLLDQCCAMRIFSNFDTQYKAKCTESCIKEYGPENVLVVRRSRLFARLYIYIPWTFYTSIGVGLIYMTISQIDIAIIHQGITSMLVIALLVAYSPIIKKFIDYKMDFGIITPKGVIFYNQTWFLKRSETSLSINNIRTITIKKSWLLYSIFNNGDMIILSEWSDISLWEVRIFYIHNPDMKRERIKEIFSKWQVINY